MVYFWSTVAWVTFLSSFDTEFSAGQEKRVLHSTQMIALTWLPGTSNGGTVEPEPHPCQGDTKPPGSLRTGRELI